MGLDIFAECMPGDRDIQDPQYIQVEQLKVQRNGKKSDHLQSIKYST